MPRPWACGRAASVSPPQTLREPHILPSGREGKEGCLSVTRKKGLGPPAQWGWERSPCPSLGSDKDPRGQTNEVKRSPCQRAFRRSPRGQKMSPLQCFLRNQCVWGRTWEKGRIPALHVQVCPDGGSLSLTLGLPGWQIPVPPAPRENLSRCLGSSH